MVEEEVFRTTPSERPEHPFMTGAVGIEDEGDIVELKHFIGFLLSLVGSIFVIASVAAPWAAKSEFKLRDIPTEHIYLNSSPFTIWLYILALFGLLTILFSLILLLSYLTEKVNINRGRFAFLMFAISSLVILSAVVGLALILPGNFYNVGGGLAISGGALTLVGSMFFSSLKEVISFGKKCISMLRRGEPAPSSQPSVQTGGSGVPCISPTPTPTTATTQSASTQPMTTSAAFPTTAQTPFPAPISSSQPCTQPQSLPPSQPLSPQPPVAVPPPSPPPPPETPTPSHAIPSLPPPPPPPEPPKEKIKHSNPEQSKTSITN